MARVGATLDPQWAVGGGGPGDDMIGGISADGDDLYVTGTMGRKATFAGLTLNPNSVQARLLLGRLTVDGALQWGITTDLPGDLSRGIDVATAPGGGVVLLGQCAFPTTIGGLDVCKDGSLFVAALDRQGTVTGVHNARGPAQGRALAVDRQGVAYVLGEFSTTVTLGQTVLTAKSHSPNGSCFIWKTQ